MKVDHTNVGGIKPDGGELAQANQTGAARGAGGGSGERAGEAGGRGPVDEISLSSLSQRLRELAVDAANREERVEQLASAQESGSYQVDAARLSRSLIDDAFQGSDFGN